MCRGATAEWREGLMWRLVLAMRGPHGGGSGSITGEMSSREGGVEGEELWVGRVWLSIPWREQ